MPLVLEVLFVLLFVTIMTHGMLVAMYETLLVTYLGEWWFRVEFATEEEVFTEIGKRYSVFLGRLLSCPTCVSHWLAAVFCLPVAFCFLPVFTAIITVVIAFFFVPGALNVINRISGRS